MLPINDRVIIEKIKALFVNVFEYELIEEIIESGYYMQVLKDDILVDIGDEMSHIPLILDGLIKITRENHDEQEILLYYLNKGDSCAISYVNCIHHNKSMFRGIAEKDTECIMLPLDKIEDWLIKYKKWREFVIDSYHNRLIEMVETIRSLAFLRLDDRLINYLTKQVELMKNKNLRITHREIATDLHTSRVVISRLLKILERQGRIKLGRNSIKVKV